MYLGIIFILTQIFDTLYFIKLSDKFFLMGGDISYCALFFAAIFLLISQPKPEVVRNLILFMLILNFFIFLLFLFLNQIFIPNSVVIYLDFSDILLQFSFKSLLLSFLLFSGEIFLQLIVMKKIIIKFHNQYIVSTMVWFFYAAILVLDGILYPIGINLLFPGSNFSIKYSIFAKIIFGLGFGVMLFIYLNIFPKKMIAFSLESSSVSVIRYFLPPKRKKLLEKYKNAKEQISQLEKILPICSVCKKIRDDKGNWEPLEEYLNNHEELSFSHSYCPECEKKAMNEIDNL
ncbi:MAG: hypothetical protein ACTSVU_06635 [Promethearchaeota archaeon]